MTTSTTDMLTQQVQSRTSDILALRETVQSVQTKLDAAIAEQAQAVAALNAIDPENEMLAWAEESRVRVVGK